MAANLFTNPFPCANPAAQCWTAPDLVRWNQRLGCLALNGDSGDGGECLFHACPPVVCGDRCPPPCPLTTPHAECAAWYAAAKGEWNASCTDFRIANLTRMVMETPMAGCTGPCRVLTPATATAPAALAWHPPAEGASGCCTVAADPAAKYDAATNGTPLPNGQVGTVSYDAARVGEPWELAGAARGPAKNAGPAPTTLTLAADRVTMYEKFLNLYTNCATSTCRCPVDAATAGTPSLTCSGNGRCEVTSEAGAATVTYGCVCEKGYTGGACAIAGINTLCPTAWSAVEMANKACGGALHGTCNRVTKRCECLDGWTGDACDVRTCPGINGTPCSGNGTCNVAASTCSCEPGFVGAACNGAVDPATGKTVWEKSTPRTAPADGSGVSTDNGVSGAASAATTTMVTAAKRDLVIGVGVAVALLLGLTAYFLFVHKASRRALLLRRAEAEFAALAASPPAATVRRPGGTAAPPRAPLPTNKPR